MSTERPTVSVVIPTVGRRVGLLWALDALADQRLPDGTGYEVLVVHDETATPVLQAAAEHPLVLCGVARLLRADDAHAAHKRNAGWRAARAPLVAFTDDDCRPRPDWLAALLDAGAARPDALLQGGAAIDPDQHDVAMRAPRPRVQTFVPPTPWAELCSLALPRAWLERVDGLDESYRRAGEDTDLAWRLREAGAAWVAVPDAIVDHAVETPGLWGTLRTSTRFAETVRVVSRHPGLRAHLPLGRFWSPAHAWLLVAAAGAAWAAGARRPGPLALATPYVAWHATRYGRTPRGVARSLTELPGDLLIDMVQTASFARASVRERTMLL
ncbi:MAG: glycosyltransferase family 2 protein [Solirubrobacteraceae bacterium]